MPTPLRALRPAGDRAVLVELASLAEVLSLQAQLREHPMPGQVDVLAAATTVLVTAESHSVARGFAARLRELDVAVAVETDSHLVTIDAVYDGADLAAVAELTGRSRDGVVAAHTGQVWTAAFGGFAPGFAYLVGENPQLTVPRRDSPRTAVPAGSVGLAGAYSAVYPRESPGGWQLIGRTRAAMWDLSREVPALIRPGNRVQFRPVRELVVAGASTPAAPDAHDLDDPAGGLVVRSPGLQTTVQDLGRPGYADLGVATAGALDRSALRRANGLVGNAASSAALENVLGGLALEALTDQVLAVTGAQVSITITGPGGPARTASIEAPWALLAGESVTLGAPATGVRSYVAVRGGLDSPAVLGSRSTDTMSGLGPPPLAAGDHLRVLAAPATSVVVSPGTPPAAPGDVTELRFVPGPREDWFTPDAVDLLGRRLWTVTAQSNRIGLRLDGEPLVRARGDELPSEGTVNGSIQVPPSGLPVLFLADHPVTGGYPVIGVVLAVDLDRAAQLPTGARIRFVPAPDAAAVAWAPRSTHPTRSTPVTPPTPPMKA